jgi:hypothetical protein
MTNKVATEMTNKPKRVLSPEHLEKLRQGRENKKQVKEEVKKFQSVADTSNLYGNAQENNQTAETDSNPQPKSFDPYVTPGPLPIQNKSEDLDTPIYIHHERPFTLYKLDNFLDDPRIGHLDWAMPDLSNYNPASGILPAIQPFGELISFFVYRPYLRMDGIYDPMNDSIIGNGERMLNMRPDTGAFEKKVFGKCSIPSVQIPVKISGYNPLTGKNELQWHYKLQSITIDNEFANNTTPALGQIYKSQNLQNLSNQERESLGVEGYNQYDNRTASMQLKSSLNDLKAQYIPPALSEAEANAIVSGRYNGNTEIHNITACTATKNDIRRSTEYKNKDIQEFVLMTLGDEVLYDEKQQKEKIIKAKDNLALIAVNLDNSFSWTTGRSTEALEHNKGYLVIDDREIHRRKVHLSKINSQVIVKTAEIKYGADDETIRRALSAYNATINKQ